MNDNQPSRLAHAPTPPRPYELAAHLAARLCHDFISPAGAIMSGLDLLNDPDAQDMRDDALRLIAASSEKLVALLAFDRVAFGASAAAEAFDVRELERLTRDVYAHGRAELDWAVDGESLAKPVARVLLNLAQIGAGLLPTGGTARLTVTAEPEETEVCVRAEGAKVRLRPEVADGLAGLPLGDGLGGHWVQAYYLKGLVDAADGALEIETAETVITVRARLRTLLG
ncbi:MAG TPA: histidine phosphotransferase family protein [Caulobacteraceae bacterium]|nr:histidine phosphotransferase family protein [Caulobacteraceae bacterium]